LLLPVSVCVDEFCQLCAHFIYFLYGGVDRKDLIIIVFYRSKYFLYRSCILFGKAGHVLDLLLYLYKFIDEAFDTSHTVADIGIRLAACIFYVAEVSRYVFGQIFAFLCSSLALGDLVIDFLGFVKQSRRNRIDVLDDPGALLRQLAFSRKISILT